MTEKKAPRDSAFESLLASYYGGPSTGPRHPAAERWLPRSDAELLAGYYGKKRSHHHHHHHVGPHHIKTLSVEASFDDGETPGTARNGNQFEEYVVSRQLADDEYQEYVVERAPMDAEVAASLSSAALVSDAEQEWHLDMLDPLGVTTPPNQSADMSEKSATRPVRAKESPKSLDRYFVTDKSECMTAEPIQPSSGPTDDDFLSDMQSILGGTHVWDQETKRAKPKTVASQSSVSSTSPPAAPSASNGQAIFDKIAESMKHANAYDLGTVELDNRFSDFDREWDQQRTAEKTKQEQRVKGADSPAPAPLPTTADFLQDLDAVRESVSQSAAVAPPADSHADISSGPTIADPGAGTLWGDASADDGTAVALDVGSSGNVSTAFVQKAFNTNFSNAMDVNAYFALQGFGDFIKWFNSKAAGQGPWKNKAIGSSATTSTNFVAIWNRIPQIFGAPSINLMQFLSLMSIFINEVGAILAPISERVGTPAHPGLSYAFDRIPNKKQSYNMDGPGWTALKCFNDPDFIASHRQKPLGSELSNTSDRQWAGFTYPSGVSTDPDPAITGFIREADFYKFRGRGLIQTTWRAGYKALIRYIQSYAGAQPAIARRARAWQAMTTDQAASISSNSDWDDLFMNSDLEIACVAIDQHNSMGGNYLTLSPNPLELNGRDVQGSIWRIGKKISGGNAYADLLRNRVIALCSLLEN